MKLFTAPETILFLPKDGPMVFLAGSIDNGQAGDWQAKLIAKLTSEICILLNPRRKEWNPDWEQTIKNPQFVEQVNWELDGIGMSDIVIFYFEETSKSPITLLELGLTVKQSNQTVIIYCPEGFYRKGNVDIVGMREGIQVFSDEDKFTKHLIKVIKEFENS